MIINIHDIQLKITDKRNYIKFYPGALISFEPDNCQSKLEINENKEIKIIGNIKNLSYALISDKNNCTGSITNNKFTNTSCAIYDLIPCIFSMFFPFNPKTQTFKLNRLKPTLETKLLIKEMNRIYPKISLLRTIQ